MCPEGPGEGTQIIEKALLEGILVEGCMSDEAKETITQLLYRRMAELGGKGLKAEFILKLQDEVDQLPNCKEFIKGE